jgi:hypothetical protein
MVLTKLRGQKRCRLNLNYEAIKVLMHLSHVWRICNQEVR